MGCVLEKREDKCSTHSASVDFSTFNGIIKLISSDGAPECKLRATTLRAALTIGAKIVIFIQNLMLEAISGQPCM
jgi:hypothetical protein